MRARRKPEVGDGSFSNLSQNFNDMVSITNSMMDMEARGTLK